MDTNQEQLYIKGFNNGYVLAQHEPELAAMIVKAEGNDNPYLQGFVSGKKEFELEKINKRLKVNPDKSLEVSKQASKDKGRGK